MDRREREANRRLNAELLAKQLRELSTGNREPDSWRRRRLSRGYTNCVPEYRVIDGDCSIFACAVATDSETSEAESDLGEADRPENADPEKAWLQGFEKLGMGEHVPYHHGPVNGDGRDKRHQHRSDSGAATGSPSTMTEAAVSSPHGPKDHLSNNQHDARNAATLLGRDTLRDHRDRRKPRKKLSIPVPRMIDPNMSICRRDYIRRDSIQDGVRLAMIPKTDIGEHKLLLPNVLNAVEYARGYRPAPVRRMRLEGDDDDNRGCDSSFDIMKDLVGSKDTSMESSVEGSVCNEPMLQKKNFWLGFSTLAAWILRIR